jgi:hypothetical protein
MAADFTPNLNPYSGQGSFRFWVQKVLPLVYDDSLSYYELLCKVVTFLNNVIQDMDTAEENIELLRDTYNQLQNYVNTYFDNLDIETELDNILNNIDSIFDFAYESIKSDDEDFAEYINDTQDQLYDYLRRAGLITEKEINLI